MRLPVIALALSLCLSVSAAAQKKVKPNTEEDADAAQQRAIAISLVSTLADEARSFKDQTRRARVQARAADVLWDSDPERARELFRRAWEAAEIVDAETAKKRAEETRRLESAGEPVVVRGGPSLRSEVLRLVAKRDRKLGEEFLKALDEAAEKERSEAATNQRLNNSGTRAGASQRLQLARRLVEDGEVQRAMEFAGPALDTVNVDSIFFLSALREKNAQLADSAYATLLARVVRDPNSDANTVAGLSSYLFTPFLYVTFERDGGSNQNRGRGPTPPPAGIDATLQNNFFKVAYQILMQPLPAPDQDRTTSGQTGKYLIIKRLLPLFEQYAADLAPGLRTQMTALASYVPPGMQQGENRAVSTGILPEESEGDPFQRMQERLDRATKSDDRDAIYADYAVAFSEDGDARARDLVDKIENTELRKSVKAYADFGFAQHAVRNKDVAELMRLVKSGELTSVQKVWALTSAAKLVQASERSRATEMLEQALAESHRISGSDPDRARALTAVAVGFGEVDRVRAWEVLAEVVKAANGAESYTGEDSRITSRLQTKFMVVMNSGNAEDFDLLAVFRHLARADLLRAIQLAKTFTGEAPRAVATLAIARSVLEKRKEVATN
jgi:predicted negative regulator of RcsB-dependent stress response